MGATRCLPAAAGLGQVFISSVVWFGLELALMQQGQQLGDLLQDRKNLLTPHNSDPARFLAGCFPQTLLLSFYSFSSGFRCFCDQIGGWGNGPVWLRQGPGGGCFPALPCPCRPWAAEGDPMETLGTIPISSSLG